LGSEVRGRLNLFAWAGFLLVLSGCAAPSLRPIEYLDERTAATVTAVATPYTFARERPELASNARDYVTMGAVNVNRSGRIETVLLVYVWSTIDPRLRPGGDLDTRVLTVLAGDRALRFTLDPRTPEEAGISRMLHAPRGVNVRGHIYRTDAATLRFLSLSDRLRSRLGENSNDRPFELWRSGQAALTALLSETP
jgi:hypothetical protein